MSLAEFLQVTITKDKLAAYLQLRSGAILEKIELNKTALLQFLEKNKVTFGIKYNVIEELLGKPGMLIEPLLIAAGIDKIDGKDGFIEFMYDDETKVERSEEYNFRDVMRIPTVQEGEPLAKIINPTPGVDGTAVTSAKIHGRKGRRELLKPGKNVVYNEEDQIFYAKAIGQVSLNHRTIHVHNVYEIRENISMKIGNVDFPGTVIIYGDVPSGFTIKAGGDIKIYGIVEGAQIIAENNVFISEGMAGLKIGTISAGDNIHIGYVNQGKLMAGNSIYIERSLLHSYCEATNDVKCNYGNIIGGEIHVGREITTKDIGNRMSTLTEVFFNINQTEVELEGLMKQKLQLGDNLQKMTLLLKKLAPNAVDSKTRITILKIKNSIQSTEKSLQEVNGKLAVLSDSKEKIEPASLKVKGTLFPNVSISFGKYKRIVDKQYVNVRIMQDKNEIVIR